VLGAQLAAHTARAADHHGHLRWTGMSAAARLQPNCSRSAAQLDAHEPLQQHGLPAAASVALQAQQSRPCRAPAAHSAPACCPRAARLELAAGGVVQHAAVVGDLVEGQQQEAHVHALHNGAQAGHGGTHACRRVGGGSEGGVNSRRRRSSSSCRRSCRDRLLCGSRNACNKCAGVPACGAERGSMLAPAYATQQGVAATQ